MDFSETYYRPFSKTLDELGFCTMRVFNDEHIQQLSKLYEDGFGSNAVNGLYASHNSNPAEKGLAVSEAIRKIVNDSLQPIFPDYNYFIGHFMVKGPHVQKEFALHQDWNIVDESKHKSYQIWIPLQLTYPANGGMFVVPGSHRFWGNQRSGSYGIPVIPFDEHVQPLVTDIIVPPGNVLVYHNGLFHASHPNQTNETRVAVIVNYVEKSAPTYYFHKNEEAKTTDLYTIDSNILLSHLPQLEKGITSALKHAGEMPLCDTKNSAITSTHLEEKYRKVFGSLPATQIKQLHIAADTKLEDELNREGYTVIDLLDSLEVEIFRKEYDVYFNNLDRTPGRFTTLQHTDANLKKKMHEFIVQEMDKPLRAHFKDFVIPVSQFYTKKNHTSGDIDLHADSTLLLNHQLEPHYAIWIPLLDVDAENGTLTVIPRSHLVKKAFFGGSIGGYHHQHLDWLRQFEIPISLKAGQAVIFDNNLLHNSTANKTAIDRVCVTFRMTHVASQYYSFMGKDDGSFDVWEETADYYMAENWDGDSKNSSGKFKGNMKHSRTSVERNKLEKILVSASPSWT